MKKRKVLGLIIGMILIAGGTVSCSSKEEVSSDSKKAVEILNVSYDPTRELYLSYNESFTKYWKDKTGQDVTINQAHGGSGAQGRAVIDGLEADVVTLALGYDIDAISDAGLINKDWQSKLDDNSSPYTSTVVFVVRKGNPKNIKDWNDIVNKDVSVITSNPKTSGGARWNYLAAWAYEYEKTNGDEKKAEEFVSKVYKNVEVLDSGSRGATTTFAERGIGDVLIAWENEAYLTVDELGLDKFEIITPSLSILAEPPVAVVDKVVDNRGTREVSEEYLKYLYSKEGQEIVAKNHYRPIDKEVAEKYKDKFSEVKLATIDDVFGGWQNAQKTHFSDGGIFDRIYAPKKQ
ncbi:MAG: sulfate ABC transporter substrate-binding protein [Clostridium sp.]